MSESNYKDTLASIFVDSELEDELRDQVTNLNPQMSYQKLPFTTPLKQQQSAIQFNSSKIKEIRTYQKDNRFEVVYHDTQKIEETIEYVKMMGIFEKQTLQQIATKIAQLKKLTTQIVETYFNKLNRQFDRIQTNEDLQIFKNKILMELMELRQAPDETKFLRLRESVQLKDQELAKQIYAKTDLSQLDKINDLLKDLIHLDFKEELHLAPILKPKLVLSTQNQLRVPDDAYACFNHKIYQLNSSKPQEIQIILEDHSLPDKTSLIWVKEVKQLLFFCNTFQNIPSNQVIRYNLITQSIQECQPMPQIIEEAQIIQWENNIFLFGGRINYQNQSLFSKRGYRYEIMTDSWSRLESMMNPRYKGSICSYGKKIVLLGGMQNSITVNNLIEIYNTQYQCFENPLNLLNFMSYHPPIKGFMMQVSNNQILTFGGRTHSGCYCPTQIIDMLQSNVIGGDEHHIEKQDEVTLPILVNQKPRVLVIKDNEKVQQYSVDAHSFV